MALTEETQAQIAAQIAAQKETEADRRAHEAQMDKRRTKLELVRMAKDVLLENARHKPAENATVTAEQITAFAEELIQYIGD